jgi:hypothetical protein
VPLFIETLYILIVASHNIDTFARAFITSLLLAILLPRHRWWT